MKEENKKKGNVPNLRFPEFEGEWEWHKLGDIANISKGSGISKDQLSEQGHPCILYGELYTKYKSEVIQKIISCTDIDNRNLVKSQANDVIIPSSGETAIDIATARYIPFSDILLGGDINIIRLKKDNGGFLSYQLNGIRKRDIAKVAQGVSVIHLYGESLKKLDIAICSREEQIKIARFLSLLDERIATQNKIIEQYKSLINGLIDLTFANADRTPYSIANLGEPFRVMGLSKDDLSEDGRECILYGELFTTYGPVINEIKSKTRRIIPKLTLSTSQDLLFPSSTTVDARSLISPSAITKAGVILGGDMFGIRVDMLFNNRYLSYLFNSVYKNLLAKYAKGSTIVHLYYSEIKDVKIELPDLLVQNKIVKILSLLENKLGIETALQSMYQSQKEYLLRGVFI